MKNLFAKYNNETIVFLCLIFLCHLHGFSQCAVSSLTIRSGFDSGTGTYLSPGSTDYNWTVIHDLDPLTTEPHPAYVWYYVGGGYSLDGGLNSGPTATNVMNVVPIVLTYTFYISCADLLSISLDYWLWADDEVDFYLNGNYVDHGLYPTSACAFPGNSHNFSTCNTLSNSTFFNVGVNTISMELYNYGGPMYFRFAGVLTTSHSGAKPFITASPCQEDIAGQKFVDTNGNGVKDISETTSLSNWPIELKNSFGNLISATTTNANGYYVFFGLPAATYHVNEGSQSGYYQTFPASKEYTVNLTATSTSTCYHFGNQVCPGPGSNIQFDVPANACTGPMKFVAGPCATYGSYSWDFGDGTFGTGPVVTHNFAAAGTYIVSLSAPGATTFTRNVTINSCAPPQTCVNCIGSFAPDPGDYILSLWVKEDTSPVPITFNNVEVQVSFIGDPTVFTFGTNNSKNKVIEGWQRIEESFSVPSAATHVTLKLVNTAPSHDVYFDDIRILPKDGQMKSYVYDPVTLKLSAVLDENNYATLYEYDEEGKLIRVKKETEKGIMTVQENRENLKKQ